VGALRLEPMPGSMPSYAELINLDRIVAVDAVTLRSRVEELMVAHLARRPLTNPVERLYERIRHDAPRLVTEDPEFFHGYAFGTLRQCGAWADVAAAFVVWLDDRRLDEAAVALESISSTAKSCQFQLARIARGREADLGDAMGRMAAAWSTAYTQLVDVHAG
jgi:hypothetical protein